MLQTHIQAYKTMIKVEIKLLQLVLRLQDREAEECFKDETICRSVTF
jgi:hypothetical protein